ncbi:hypothetical protein [Lysobacter gummosus]|uniref:hypothetical protein n=1 Tax=Lysobacter gummosus TaxID=262324 RepID=UPI003634787E
MTISFLSTSCLRRSWMQASNERVVAGLKWASLYIFHVAGQRPEPSKHEAAFLSATP